MTAAQLGPEDFTAMSALQFGFDRYISEAGYCFAFTAMIELMCLVSSGVIAFCFITAARVIFGLDAPPPESFIVTMLLVYLVVRTAAQSIINRWLLLLCDGEPITIDELFGIDLAFHLPGVLRLFASSLVYTFYCVMGTILLIVPGIFAASTLRFYRFLIVDKDADAVEGLRESYLLSTGHKGQLIGLQLLCGVLKLLGLCVFGVGYIPASAVCGLAEAYAYRCLSAENLEATAAQQAHLN